ncbi:hypothetical protein [Prevotella sp. KH2C16]|uniref:DUF6984 family protein n=1 Tax=Prevotella sp. KH2C16 TaxID=1855325 RepID=UPI0008F2D7E5|nr:hypothetical protein [Prevotella sp. KH2C16]SFG77804.1 hypothetical protein SAMN05216383_1462 [Prevotella sp. KH2C16]
MEYKRHLTTEEFDLVKYLAKKADYHLSHDWVNHVKAYPLTKDRIGSIAFIDEGEKEYTPQECTEISCCRFYDSDGIEVVAYLLVDSYRSLRELDLWKVDYSSICRIPSVDNMMDVVQI